MNGEMGIEERRQEMRKIWVFLCGIVLCVVLSQTVHAEEVFPEKELLDIVFVLDCSGSMKSNDSSRSELNMVQAFIDTAQAERVRIGYVAYSDEILSCSALEAIGTVEARTRIKEEIAAIEYSGNTDMGLGVSCAYGLFSMEDSSKKVMVLISDGKTDLPGNGERTVEQSNKELMQCVQRCEKDGVRIYTIAFGQYEGSRDLLEQIAKDTGAESFSAQNPESMIEVIYGIFQGSLAYRIQQFSNGVYAGGNQEIKCVLDTPHLDEIDVLLLSSGQVGESTVRCGDREIPLGVFSRYAVGKMEGGIGIGTNELTVHTVTEEGQDLQVYILGYRKVMPVLEVQADAGRNQEIAYQVYFKDLKGNVVKDAGFYEAFKWDLVCTTADASGAILPRLGKAAVSDGILKGSIRFLHSGRYALEGSLSDELGNYAFSTQVEVRNSVPYGSIPETEGNVLERGTVICLDDWFKDDDGDQLSYSVLEGEADGLAVQLDENRLEVTYSKSGTYLIPLQISDGEDVIQYVHRVSVVPLWRVYWWAIAGMVAVTVFVGWMLLHKPKQGLEVLSEEKKRCHFCGKLDAYFMVQPEKEDEIPPLSFQMSRIKDNRVSLGVLFGMYPKQVGALQLNDIHLIADENRSMVLYHMSDSGVSIGNSIACKQIRYSVNFGDVIYITSPDGSYDLEIHYIAVIQ